MTAIVSGNALGLNLTSLAGLGGHGIAGHASFGRNGEQAYVNAATGNLVLQDHDDALIGRGLDIAGTRTYNSQGAYNDDNGDNWSSGFYRQQLKLVRITVDGVQSTAVSRTDRDGSEAVYTMDAVRGIYVATDGAGAYDTVSHDTATGTYTWTDGSTGVSETYLEDDTSIGPLFSTRDADGNSLSFAYNADGLVSSVTNALGEQMRYDYNGDDLTQIRTVTSNAGVPQTLTRVRYAYDANHRLSSVAVDLSPQDDSIADGNTYVTTYAYDGASTRVARITQTDGSTLSFSYVQLGADYRIASVHDALGQRTDFSYDVGARRTTVTDPLGLVSRFDYDSAGQLLAVTMPAVDGVARTASFTYNAHGDVTQMTDGVGATTTMAYDAHGNTVLQRDSVGNTVTRTFDTADRLSTETIYTVADPDGAGSAQPGGASTTRYVYGSSSSRQARFVVTSEGRVTENRFDAYGNAVSTIGYAASSFDLSSFGAAGVPSEAQLSAWVDTQDRTRSSRVDSVYDFRGQLQSRTRYVSIDAAGNGVADSAASTEHFVHDAAGLLISTLSASGGYTGFVYDGLGRTLGVTDALGHVTVTQYDDANARTTVTLANGLATTSAYDAAGQLMSVQQRVGTGPSLGQTLYRYDADSRLVMSQDPTGLRAWFLYDAEGRKSADIDATGKLTEYAYDGAGRLTLMRIHAAAVDTRVLVDADGNPTMPSLVSLRPPATVADQSQWRCYDSAGRLVKAVGASGAVEETFYDGASRIIGTTAYAATVSTASLGATPSASSIAPAANAADRSTRRFYDGDGLLLAHLDAEGYLSENRYDAASRLVAQVRYASATNDTWRAHGTLDALRPASQAADQLDFFFYNAKGQLAAWVDAEKNLTENVYDADDHLTMVVRYATRVSVALSATSSLASIRPASTADDRVTSRSFDASGRLATETAIDGSQTRFTYDAVGNLVTTVTGCGEPDARSVNARFDLQGRLVGELSGVGSALLNGGLTSAEIDAVWAQYGLAHTYDAAGRRTSTTDANGNRTLFFYDADGRLLDTVNALGEVQESRYDTLGQRVGTVSYGTRIETAALVGGVIDEAFAATLAAIANPGLDSRTSVTYNASGSVATSTDALGHVTTLTHDAFDEVTSRSRVLGGTQTRVDTTSYDRRGFAVLHADDSTGINASTAFVHDAFGRVTQTTDATGNVSRTVFDRLGRTVQTIDASNSLRSASYDAFDRVLTQTNALGRITHHAYSSDGRSVTITTPEGVTTTTTVTRDGQTLSITDGNGHVTHYAYDLDGQLLSSTAPLATTSQVLDRAGQLIETTNANGIQTRYTYDAAGRVLTRTEDANGRRLVTTYAYDAKGQQVSVTDPLGVQTVTSFDLDGEVVRQMVDPGGLRLETVWAYDASGHRLSVTDPNGVLTQYMYDTLGRRVADVVDPFGLSLTTSYTYDKDGNVTSVDNNGQLTRHVVDALGRVVLTVDPAMGVQRYEYDAEGQVVRSTRYATPVAAGVLPIESTAAQVLALLVSQPAKDQVERSRYDGDGRLTFSVDATGAVTQFVHDAEGHVVLRRQYANAIDAGSWNMATDPPVVADASRDALARTVYDAMNRVAFTADALGHVVGRAYDAAGQLIASVEYANAVADGTSPASVLASAADRTNRFAYDAAGRMVLSVDALGGVTEQGFDADGQVVARREYAHPIGLPSAGTPQQNDALSAALIRASLQPDAAIDRITRYAYDAAGRLTHVVDPTGAVTESVYDRDGHVAVQIRYANTVPTSASAASVVASAADQVTRFVYDAAGRQRVVVSALGVVTNLAYLATGEHWLTRVYRDPIALPTGSAEREPMTFAQVWGATNLDDYRDTRYNFDAAGRTTRTTVGIGTDAENTTMVRYDALGQVVASIDSRGFALAYDNTPWARAERTRLGFAADVNALSSAQGESLLERYTTRYTYDAAGHRLTTQSPAGTSSSSYDAFGHATVVTDPLGHIGHFYFDQLGRVTVQIDPEGFATRTTYTAGFDDKVASVTRFATRVTAALTGTPPALTTSANDATTAFLYDLNGRVTVTTDATGASESVGYGVDGNRFDKRAVNKLGGVAVYRYDQDGRQLSETLPVFSRTGGSSAVAVVNTYRYDAFGNRVESTEAVGLPEQRVTKFRYDAANRVVARIGQACVAFDALTQNASVVTPAEATRYNAFGDVVDSVTRGSWDGSAVQGGEHTWSYFDGAGRLSASVAPDGAVVSFARDAAGHVVKQTAYATALASAPTAPGAMPAPAVDPDHDRVTDSVYDAAGRLTLTQRERVVHWEASSTGTITLDLAGTQPDTVTLQQLVYDANGNVVQQVDGRGHSIYNYYDKAGRRVLTVDQDGYATAWDYADVFDTATRETRYSTHLATYWRQDDAGRPLAERDPSALRATLDAQATGADRVATSLFDRAGRVLEARVKNVVYDGVGADGVVTHRTTDAVTEYRYDGLGNVTETRELVAEVANGAVRITNTTDIAYDLLGRETDRRLPGYVDQNGAKVRPASSIEYDGLGNIVRTLERGTDDTSEADDHVTTYRYNVNGDRTQVVDALGNITKLDLDVRGRIARTTVVGVRNADGDSTDVVTQMRYDAAGRLVVQTDLGTGEVRKTAYNAFGDIRAKGVGDGWQEFIQYNTLGKVEKSNTGSGVTKIYLYDANGNATRQITSGTIDLTGMSVMAAAVNTSLLHTFSNYDARNELVRTVEPDISYLQDQVSVQGAFTQQLAPLYGAIAQVGNSAGGTYTQGSVNTASYGLTQVTGSGGVVMMANPPAAPTGTFSPAFGAGSHPNAPAPTGAFGISIAWEGSTSGTYGGTAPGTHPPPPSAYPITVPNVPAYTYRLVGPTGSIQIVAHGAVGQVPASDTGYTSLQFQVPGTSQWVEVSQLRNVYSAVDDDNGLRSVMVNSSMSASTGTSTSTSTPDSHASTGGVGTNAFTTPGTWTRTISSTESSLVFIPKGGSAITMLGIVNDAAANASPSNVRAMRDATGAVVADWYVVDSLPAGASSVTLRGYDAAGLLVQGDRLAISIGDGATVSATALAKLDVWAEPSNGIRNLRFSTDRVGPSATFYVRPVTGGSYAATGFTGRALDIGAMALPRNRDYDFYVTSGGVESHGQFHLNADGIPELANGGILQTVSRPAPSLSFDVSGKLSDTGASSYTFVLTIGGHELAGKAFGGGSVSFDVATELASLGVDKYSVGNYAYSYRVYGERGGIHQFVGQGSGNVTMGADFSAPVPATQGFRPIGSFSGGSLAGAITLTSSDAPGPVQVIAAGDWRRVQVGATLNLDLSQWLRPVATHIQFAYDAGDAHFSGSFVLDSTGKVTLETMTCSTRQPFIPISIPGATQLTVLRVGLTDATLAPAPGALTTSGSTFTWDASAFAGSGAQRLYYEAVSAQGVLVSKGYATFTLAADGTLTYAIGDPQLLPSSFRFTPPSTATAFVVRVRPSGSNAAWTTYSTLQSDGSLVIDANGMRPGSGVSIFDCTYEARDANGAIVSSGGGPLTVGANGVTSSQLTENHKPTIVTLQGPPNTHVPYLQIAWRPVNSTGAYSSANVTGVWDATRKVTTFTWDASALVPLTDTARYEYVMTMQNADHGAMLNAVGGTVQIGGVMTLGGSASSPVEIQQYVTQLSQAAQVKHTQTYNAFGEIASEYDDNVYQRAQAMAARYHLTASADAGQTEFTYNALGKLISKTDPETTITLANGYSYRARPVTTYGYDLTGRTVTLTDANGNVTRQDYAGAGEHVADAWAADGGHKRTAYDVFGNARALTDELGHVTLQSADALGHVTQVQHLGVSRVVNLPGPNAVASTLTDSYAYDALGRRIAHTNTLGWTDKTYYDSLDRVTRTLSAANAVTSYAYSAVAAGTVNGILGAGGRNVGGYQLTTTAADGRSTTDRTDYFGHTTWHQDEGGRTYVYSYDIAGRLSAQTSSAGQNLQYTYFANGDLASSKDLATHTFSRYGYDNAGNRTWEAYGSLDAGNTSFAGYLQNSTIAYDELNRIATVTDATYQIRYDYDAVGNRRAVHAAYLDPVMHSTVKTDDFWYTYDAANRFTTTKGAFTGPLGTSATDTRGAIVIGPQGVQLTYDLAGQRTSARNADGSLERYSYTAEGYLEDTTIDGTLRARRGIDSLGRTVDYTEWEANSSIRQEKTSVYDQDNRLLQDKLTHTDRNGTTDYAYFDTTADSPGAVSTGGRGTLARANFTAADAQGTSTSTLYTYQYWDSAKQATVKTMASNQSVASWAPGVSELKYDVNGYLTQAKDNAANRTLAYTNNATGLVLKRDESVGADLYTHNWYYAAGQKVGDITTDPNDSYRQSYAEALAVNLKDLPSDKDRFKNYRPATSADFDQNYEPISASYPGATATSYTVRTGDTLKAIAQSLWGDSSMWYLIAEANSLSGRETLNAGQVLAIPNKVTNIHNNSTTIRPYSPGEVIGHVDPTLPSPVAAEGKHGCGGLGIIIMVVVAVAVTVATEYWASPYIGDIGGAALGGAAGSVASQEAGIALGNVDHLSWKAVAQSAVGAAAGAAVLKGLDAVAKGDTLLSPAARSLNSGNEYVRAAVIGGSTTALAQVVEARWSWREVAASAAGSAAGRAVGNAVSAATGDSLSLSTKLTSGFARSMAAGWTSEQVKSIDSNYTAARLSTMYAGAFGNALGGALSEDTPLQGVGLSSAYGYENGSDVQSENYPATFAAQQQRQANFDQIVGVFRANDSSAIDWASDVEVADNSNKLLMSRGRKADTETAAISELSALLNTMEIERQKLVDIQSIIVAGRVGRGAASKEKYMPAPTTSAADFAVLDQVDASLNPQETADRQVIAGTYHRFSAFGDAIGSGDYTGALFHLTYTASDEAQAVALARLFPPPSLEMQRLDNMLASPIGASASVIGRLLGASQQRQDALLATGKMVEQLAGAGTGVYKQTLTAKAPIPDVLAARVQRTKSSFGGVTARTEQEDAFLRNADASFTDGSVFNRAIRFGENIVIQRSDIEFSIQNVRRMAGGNSPYLKNASGDWEKVNVHHIGRQNGKLVEILSSQNAYTPTTGGPLHIPGPGGPVRDNFSVQKYWAQRLDDAIRFGQISENVLKQLGR